jgi:hypothetical protein
MALASSRQNLLATLSSAKAAASAALAEACIAQAELDGEVGKVQALLEEVATIAGWEVVRHIIRDAQEAAAEDLDDNEDGTDDKGDKDGHDDQAKGDHGNEDRHGSDAESSDNDKSREDGNRRKGTGASKEYAERADPPASSSKGIASSIPDKTHTKQYVISTSFNQHTNRSLLQNDQLYQYNQFD